MNIKAEPCYDTYVILSPHGKPIAIQGKPHAQWLSLLLEKIEHFDGGLNYHFAAINHTLNPNLLTELPQLNRVAGEYLFYNGIKDEYERA